MKLYSWNVNGIRAASKKGFLEWLNRSAADIVCVQETKAQENQLPFDITNVSEYSSYFVSAARPGYSGVATYTKIVPEEVKIGFGVEEYDREGRVLITKFPHFTLFNIYFPNGKRSPERLAYKMAFYQYFSQYLTQLLKTEKNIIICGDVNTAHQAIDLARPQENEVISGFLPEERHWIDQFLDLGFIDTFRYFHPEEKARYSWWSQRSGARKRNVGWRIDYFYVSQNLEKNLVSADIDADVFGSDHCPISVELKFWNNARALQKAG